jgi:ABC-type spermidine/putrescine transport system permease subunit II
MFLFFVLPIGIFFVYSFWAKDGWAIVREWNLQNYVDVLGSPTYTSLILRSLGIGLRIAILAVLVVYPLAYAMVFKLEKYRDFILLLLTISLFSNYLVRIYAWRSILASNGLFNWIFMAIGLSSQPEPYLLYSQWGVILILMNVYIPFATLPIYSALLNVDRDTIEAAQDLGASPLRAFAEITLPLTMPGVIVSFLFIFLLSAGDFVTPTFVGGRTGMMIGNAIATQFGALSNWPLGSAMVFSTVLMMVAVIVAVVLTRIAVKAVQKMQRTRLSRAALDLQMKEAPAAVVTRTETTAATVRTSRVLRIPALRLGRMPLLQVYAVLALLFLFLPIVMLMILSFNTNRTGVFPLQGFTLGWYQETFHNQIIGPALMNSLIVALATAAAAALLGTPAALGLTRYHFRLKGALRALFTLPMSLPTLLVGIALLSFLVFISFPRSLLTVIIGHLVYCVPYMVLTLTAGLEEFDFTVEEAAQDLGATPFQTFRMVTFPLIRPIIIGAMLLIFATSFDMFVITFFNIGHGSTLPMVIWSMMRYGINPSLNAIGTMLIAFSIVLLVVASRLGGVKLVR